MVRDVGPFILHGHLVQVPYSPEAYDSQVVSFTSLILHTLQCPTEGRRSATDFDNALQRSIQQRLNAGSRPAGKAGLEEEARDEPLLLKPQDINQASQQRPPLSKENTGPRQLTQSILGCSTEATHPFLSERDHILHLSLMSCWATWKKTQRRTRLALDCPLLPRSFELIKLLYEEQHVLLSIFMFFSC